MDHSIGTPGMEKDEKEFRSSVAAKLAEPVDLEKLRTRPIRGGKQAAYLPGDIVMYVIPAFQSLYLSFGAAYVLLFLCLLQKHCERDLRLRQMEQ